VRGDEHLRRPARLLQPWRLPRPRLPHPRPRLGSEDATDSADDAHSRYVTSLSRAPPFAQGPFTARPYLNRSATPFAGPPGLPPGPEESIDHVPHATRTRYVPPRRHPPGGGLAADAVRHRRPQLRHVRRGRGQGGADLPRRHYPVGVGDRAGDAAG